MVALAASLIPLVATFARADQNPLVEGFNVAQHLGNLSPYFTAPSNLEKTLPDGCTVNQVSLMQRHGSRFPLAAELAYTQNVSWLIGNNTQLLKHAPPNFAFLKTWSNTLGHDSLTPPGRQQLFDHGVAFNLSYPHLFTPLIVAGDQDRVVESAQWFRMGYYGIDFADRSVIEKIEEDATTFSRITPMNNCSAWKYDYGLQAVNAWNAVYLPPVARRFNKILPGFNFTLDNIHGMLYACAYELAAYGSTPWCAVFQEKELLDFEYELDLLMDYAFGYGLPGNLGTTLGSVYVNTLVDRLGNATAEMYLDFGHDTTIDIALTALRLAKDRQTIPPKGPVNPKRAWRTSYQVPFAAQMVTERISCTRPPGPYVRILLNGAPLALPFCTHARGAPTGACTVADFIAANGASKNVTRAVYDKVCNNTHATTL